MKKIYNIGLVAHVDAGKTTTAEQILYQTGMIRELGNVNKGSAKLDYDEVEKQRGITIFSDQAVVKYKDCIINLIDTPGHVDFGAELERSLKVLDGAILIISAVEGVQSHTETIWNMLKKYNIPTILYVNKFDREGVNLNKLKDDIRLLNPKVAFLNKVNNTGDKLKEVKNVLDTDYLSEEFIEQLIDNDDCLLEKYLEGYKPSHNEIEESILKQCSNNSLIPVCFGCSIRGLGIKNLLNSILKFIPCFNNDLSDKLAAYIYKIKYDEKIGKLTYVKILSGNINVRDVININDVEEKVTAIRKYNGPKFETVQKLEAGDLGVLCGIKQSEIGLTLGIENKNSSLENVITAVLRTRVLYNEEQITDVIDCFKQLNSEDPMLNMEWNKDTRDIYISVMGIVQMEVLKQTISQRFHLDIEFDNPKVNYLESIDNITKGFNHFEPKKHFAEVEVEVEPIDISEGFKYESELSVDYLPSQYQNLIKKNMDDAVKHGVLLGAQVTGIKIKLIAGKYHLEHTHGGDFRIATIRAVQQALLKNECYLLEPIYEFKIVVDKELSGKVMSDILKMKGNLNDPEIFNEQAIITGNVPISTAMNYSMTLASMTSGKGSINFKFLKYERCHNQAEVLQDDSNQRARDEKLYNGISLLRHKKKMKKVY